MADQRMVALRKANGIRSAKSDDKKRIRDGSLDPLEILDKPPEHWRNAKIIELLLAMHRVGRHRSAHWLEMAGVSPSRTVESLSQADRYRLAGFVMYGQQTAAMCGRLPSPHKYGPRD
jgi:hypothetical protein